MLKFVRAIRGLSLALWLGSGVMTFITAKYVFGITGKVNWNLAGDTMGAILHAGALMKLVLALLAVGSHQMLRESSARKPHTRALILLGLAAAIVCVSVFYIEPKLVELRGQFMHDA